MHRSGTAGLDGTCWGRDTPRAPDSKKQRDRLAGVSRRAAETVWVMSSADDTDGDVPTGMVAVRMLSGVEPSTTLSSEAASQVSMAACIVSNRGVAADWDGCLEGWSWFTAAMKNHLSGAYSGLCVIV